MNRTVRLNETELKRIVNESVRYIINEAEYGTTWSEGKPYKTPFKGDRTSFRVLQEDLSKIMRKLSEWAKVCDNVKQTRKKNAFLTIYNRLEEVESIIKYFAENEE